MLLCREKPAGLLSTPKETYSSYSVQTVISFIRSRKISLFFADLIHNLVMLHLSKVGLNYLFLYHCKMKMIPNHYKAHWFIITSDFPTRVILCGWTRTPGCRSGRRLKWQTRDSSSWSTMKERYTRPVHLSDPSDERELICLTRGVS